MPVTPTRSKRPNALTPPPTTKRIKQNKAAMITPKGKNRGRNFTDIELTRKSLKYCIKLKTDFTAFILFVSYHYRSPGHY